MSPKLTYFLINIRVSVVIDNYNYGRYLPAAIDSVLAQDFRLDQVEIIVVDDGSTDNSREILVRYDGRVKTIFQPNSGQATALNLGLAAAQGEIVCLLDSDDVWLPGKLRRVMSEFNRRPEVGVVQHYLQEADAALSPLPQEPSPWPATLTIEDYLDGRGVFTATSGLSYRRAFLTQALPIPENLFYYLDDFLTVHTLFLAPAANIAEVLGYHRIHGANFCAEGYANARKISTDFAMRGIFRENLNCWLVHYGRALTPRFHRLEGLELIRREILFHAHEGRRGQALAAWWRGLLRHGLDGFALFRLLSCLLAVVSPRLYLALYKYYARSPILKRIRRTFL